MSSSEDQPPSEEYSSKSTQNLVQTINKLSYKEDLNEYVQHLVNNHAVLITEDLAPIRERLLLQGLDEDDFERLHNYLEVSLDGDFIKILNRRNTLAKIKSLSRHLS